MSEAHYDKSSFDARLTTFEAANDEAGKPGDFYYLENSAGDRIGISSCLPNSGGGVAWGATMFQGHGEQKRQWSWDGNVEKPTLNPSIHRLGHWHGWLRNGRFVSI